MTRSRLARRFGLCLILALLALVVALPGSAAASPPQPVTITVDTTLEPGAVDPFVATGGVVCETGTVSDLFVQLVGQSPSHRQIRARKRFVCPDGTFDVLLRVKLDLETFATSGTWTVVDGTGAYVKLHGTGSLVGEPLGPTTIRDIYTGKMHID
jgi:hypothetical protein